ncbi:MAG: EamA family transporter [Burkholderiales bacterium 28-67-8]|nr:MAG: EamA family transporter [Burkholderiales bacterium 28-67-8]
MSPIAPGWAALALVFNGLVWGLSWWPFRQLQSHGLHPLWATVLIYVPAVAVIVAFRPHSLRQLMGHRALWVLALAAGVTNAAFNWACVIGDVVRVVLLFYLMPLWSALLARWLLKEPMSRAAVARVALALAGAAIVLQPEGDVGWSVLPLPRSLAEWLGVLGGIGLALNNVLLKHQARQSQESRVLAMFVGGAVVSALVGALLSAQGQLPWPMAGGVGVVPGWVWALVLVMMVFFLGTNVALQIGATHLPAQVTSVLMLSEVLFAAISSTWLGAGRITAPLLIGGGLIVLTAVWAARERPL